MSDISQYEAYSHEIKQVKQIADSFLKNEISYNVALARLNYLYDLSNFKAYHMWFIKDV